MVKKGENPKFFSIITMVTKLVWLFIYFGCPTTVCTVYLFIYNYYILVNSFKLSTIVEINCCCCCRCINNNSIAQYGSLLCSSR